MTGRVLHLPPPWCESCELRRATFPVPLGDAEPIWVCSYCLLPPRETEVAS